MKRVVRIIEYFGTDEKINETLSKSTVPLIGTKMFSKDLILKGGVIGYGTDLAIEFDKNNIIKALEKIDEMISKEQLAEKRIQLLELKNIFS